MLIRSLWWILLGFSLGLQGCNNDDFSDLKKHIRKVKAKPKQEIAPLPESKPVEPFLFNLDGSRDPFKPTDIPEEEEEILGDDDVPSNGIKPDLNRRKEELESYPLDTLEMVGTVKTDVLWGLVRSKDGVRRVRVGNYVGGNYGKIMQITEKKIILVEIVADKKPNTWYEKDASLPLKMAAEE